MRTFAGVATAVVAALTMAACGSSEKASSNPLAQQPGSTGAGPDQVYAALEKALPRSLTVLDKSAAEDKDAIVVTKETADKWSMKSISDLKAHAGEVIFGGPPEIQRRADGLPGFKKNYDIEVKDFKALDARGPLTNKALKNGAGQAPGNLHTHPPTQAHHL